MNTIILQNLGRDICKTIISHNKSRIDNKLNQAKVEFNKEIINELKTFDNSNTANNFSGESESEESGDNLEESELIRYMPQNKSIFIKITNKEFKSFTVKKIKKVEIFARRQTKSITNPIPNPIPIVEKLQINPPVIVRKISPKIKINTNVYDMKKKIYTDNRKDEHSQTEDIFFKM